jgi:hypothetical protein
MTIHSNPEELEKRIALVNAYVLAEMRRAMAKHGKPYNSLHEASAVVREEYEEMWDEIKADDHRRAIEEAVQLAATSTRLLVDLGGDLEAVLGPVPQVAEEEPYEPAQPISFNFDMERATEVEITEPEIEPIELAAEPVVEPVSEPAAPAVEAKPLPPGPGTFGYLSAMLADVVRERAAARPAAPKAE